MTPTIFNDDYVRRALSASLAIEAIRDAISEADAGRLVAPPRIQSHLGDGMLDFTTGSLTREWFGYRSNDTFHTNAGEQVVVIQDYGSGLVRGIAIGNEIGLRRTGAIGATAVDILSRKSATTLGIIGSGPQAFSQAWAICAVREINQILVYSRNPERKHSFVRRLNDDLETNAGSTSSAEEVVKNSEVIVLATNSRNPVIDAKWVAPGSHVNTLGPKFQHRSEISFSLVDRADIVTTDSIIQLASYTEPLIFDNTEVFGRVVSLGSIQAGRNPGRQNGREISLFFSVGLAGTEVYLLNSLINATELP